MVEYYKIDLFGAAKTYERTIKANCLRPMASGNAHENIEALKRELLSEAINLLSLDHVEQLHVCARYTLPEYLTNGTFFTPEFSAQLTAEKNNPLKGLIVWIGLEIRRMLAAVNGLTPNAVYFLHRHQGLHLLIVGKETLTEGDLPVEIYQ